MTWITVLEIFLVYQFACLLIILLLEALGKDTDSVSFFLCTALKEIKSEIPLALDGGMNDF